MYFKSLFYRFSFIVLAFSTSPTRAQEAPPVFDWQGTLGGSSYDAASKIIHTSDGGFLLVGTSYSNNGDITGNHGSGDAWVVKINASGNKQWQKALGGSSVDGAVAVVEFPDGKIFVACNTNSVNGNVTSNHGSTDIWIVSLDANGTMLWQKTYGGGDDDLAKALIRTSDDHLLIGGSTQSTNGDVTVNKGGDDFWLVKIDTLGSITWQHTFGGSALDMCNGILEMSDGGYVAVGSTASVDSDLTCNRGNNDFWIIKTDGSGNLSWQKSLGGTSNESAMSAITNMAGNIVIAGYTNSNDGDVQDNKGGSDYWLVILDSAGALVNQVTYGGSNSDVAYSIVLADDGGYLISGGTYSTDFDIHENHGNEDFWLLKTDAAGNSKWSKTYGGASADRNTAALQTPDGGYVMTGYSFSNDQQVGGNHGSADMWVAQISCKSPAPSYLFADDTACVNSTVSLTNTSVNSSVYSWLANGIPFGSNTDVNFQFVSSGIYDMSLVASTCYESNQFSHNFIVYDYPAVPVVTLNGPVLESSPAPSYQWFTNGQPIAGETNQSYAVNGDGYFYVMVGNAGRCFTFSDSVYYSITGLSSPDHSALTVYPNPARDKFVVRSLKFVENTTIEIYNALGEKVYSHNYELRTNDYELKVDVSSFPNGIYLLHLESEAGSTFRKIVVSH